MFQTLLIYVALVHACISQKTDVTDDVVRFSASNGFQSINIVYSQGREKDAADILRALSATNIFTKTLKLQDILDRWQSRNKDNQIKIQMEEKFLWLPQSQDIEGKASLNVILEILNWTHIKHSLLLLDFNVDWKKIYGEADLNAYFYTLSSNSNEKWLQVLALNKVPNTITTELKWKVVNGQSVVDEEYDLQNMTITSSSLEFNQESILDECDDINLECRNTSGFFWDVIDAIGNLINITVIAYKEPSKIWGALPKVSNSSQNMVQWTGVLGSVEKRDHHMASSLWVSTLERSDFFDLCLAWFRTDAIFFTQKKAVLDTFFLLRPFDFPVWISIGLVTFAILILKYFDRVVHRASQSRNMYSTRSIFVSANIFFVLLHAFYSGALTMFNVTQEDVHFTNLAEAIKAYPTWKLIISKETVPRVTFLMSNQTKAYKELMERIEVNDMETVVDNLEQGLTRVQETRSVLLSSLLDVSQHRNLRSSTSLNRILLRRSPLFVVLGHNSPLTPSFQWGLLRLWECGQTIYIIEKSMARSSNNDIDKGPAPITMEETKIAFFAMGIVMLCSLILLLMEKLFSNFAAFFGQQNQSH